MGSLSLEEAAEKARTSKVDIWRAIREGRLSARRTDDGGFAIDPAELFRVFETQRPEQPRSSIFSHRGRSNDPAKVLRDMEKARRGLAELSRGPPLASAAANAPPLKASVS